MPFVSRNAIGQVIALLQEQSDVAPEELALNHPDVLTFLGSHEGATETILDLSRSDTDMARVIEDLVELLILKSVISIDDLPPAAQKKLSKRQVWRGGLEEALAVFGGGKVI